MLQCPRSCSWQFQFPNRILGRWWGLQPLLWLAVNHERVGVMPAGRSGECTAMITRWEFTGRKSAEGPTQYKKLLALRTRESHLKGGANSVVISHCILCGRPYSDLRVYKDWMGYRRECFACWFLLTTLRRAAWVWATHAQVGENCLMTHHEIRL